MKDGILKFIEEKCNFVFLFPVIMTYIVCPAGYAIKTYIHQTDVVVDGIMLFMSVWWIMAYYDGKFKTAAKWIMRYIVMFLPLWIACYVIYMNTEGSYGILFGLVRVVFTNIMTGTGAFLMKKITEETMVVFVLLVLLYIFIAAPPHMMM